MKSNAGIYCERRGSLIAKDITSGQTRVTGSASREKVGRGLYRRRTRDGKLRYEYGYVDSEGRYRWGTCSTLRASTKCSPTKSIYGKGQPIPDTRRDGFACTRSLVEEPGKSRLLH